MNHRILCVMLVILMVVAVFPTAISQHNDVITRRDPDGSIQSSGNGTWYQVQKLLASDGTYDDEFGRCVDVNGDTAIIGACGFDDSSKVGAAYVFVHYGKSWVQQQKLTAQDSKQGDHFGYAVCVDGDTALVGAIYADGVTENSGCAYVFTRNGSVWTQQAKLTASDGEPYDGFGCSVALEGDTALIAADWNYGAAYHSGAVFVFTRNGTIWTEEQKLVPSDGSEGDTFGFSMAVQGDTALVGTIWGDGFFDDSGCVYAFTRTGSTWVEQQKLCALDGAGGDIFGHSVSLDNGTALIGARFDENFTGSAYVFTCSGSTWTQQQKLVASDPGVDDSFGICVSVKGDTALIGAMDEIYCTSSGAAYVFTRTGTIWTQEEKLVPQDAVLGQFFGISVCLCGDGAFIGANHDSENGDISGAVYVFQLFNLPPNHAPSVTDLLGPTFGKLGVIYSFSVIVHDDDNDSVFLMWEWGDGTTSGWQGPFDNGSTVTATHFWSSEGTYSLRVRPRDVYGWVGPWSPPLQITVTQSLMKTFVCGRYVGWKVENDSVVVTAVNLWMISAVPFHIYHYYHGESVRFFKQYARIVVLPRYLIGLVYT